jgi:pimeloyl-ACP methyl ester carboxylesterase
VHLVDSTDGVRLAVHDLGGTGPVLLCSHATGFHAKVWRPMAHHLGDRYHSLAIDYRGHGDATVPDGQRFHWDGFGHDALAVVEALALDRPFAVGHSMGGAALLMAELWRPGTFAAMALFEPIVFPKDRPVPENGNPLASGARRRRFEFSSRLEAFDNYAAKPPLNVFTREALAAYVEHGFADTDHGTVQLKCQPEHEARVFEASGSHDTFERLEEIECPVLVLSGRIEPYQPSSWAHLVAERLPNARFEQSEHVGHFGPMEDPVTVASAIDTFFRSLG